MTRCGTCGHRFTPHRRRGWTFCSKRCAGVATQSRLFKPCAGCGALMVGPRSLMCQRSYCSRQCRHDATRVTYQCEACGAQRTVSRFATAKRFCGDPCRLRWFAKAFAAEASPHWQGGALTYYGPSWRAARRAVRGRDRVCRHCGEPPQLEALSVAHVTPFRTFGVARHVEANALANLIALCRPCHLRFDHASGARAETGARLDELLALERAA